MDLSLSNRLKWGCIVLLQVVLGCACVMLSWRTAMPLFFICCASIVFLLRFHWLVYAVVFFLPLIGVKYPAVQFTSSGFIQSDAMPLLVMIVPLAAFPFVLLKLLGRYRADSHKNLLFVPIILLVCYSFLSIFWSPANLAFNLFYFYYLMSNVITFFIIFRVVNTERLHRRLMWCLVASGIVLSLTTISYETLRGDPETSLFVYGHTIEIFKGFEMDLGLAPDKARSSSRARALFEGHQETSVLLSCLIIVAVGLLLNERKRWRVMVLSGAILLFLYAQFLTKTRVGLWSLVIMLGLFLALSIRMEQRVIRAAVVIALVFVTMFLITEQVSSSRRAHSEVRVLTLTMNKYDTVDSRMTYWTAGFDALKKESLTLLGLGVGGYKYSTKQEVGCHPHNLYLGLLFDFGIAGCLISLYAILVLIGSFHKIIRYQASYLQSMSFIFGVLIFGIGLMCLVYLSEYMSTLWLFLALGCTTCSLAQRELENKEPIPDVQTAGAALS
jgi:hypothetical protein